jgi:hypothetical protein
MAETNKLIVVDTGNGVPPSDVNSPDDVKRPEVHPAAIATMGFVILAAFIITGILCYSIWPIQMKDTNGNFTQNWNESVSGIDLKIDPEQRMLLLVMLAGLCGSLIHASTSFSNFVGERKLEKSWVWWYALRPFTGIAVALVFYLVFRGGLVNNTRLESLNVYGVMTMAALAGLFSDRATLKLKEIFESLFQPKDERTGKLENGNSEVDGNDGAKS